MVIQGKHLLLLFLLIVPALLFSACGPTVFHCEAMPFYIQYKSISYYAVYTDTSRALQESDLGSAITTVGDGQNQATSCQLDPGTQVYTVKGYQSAFRLAAHYNGQVTLFEVVNNPQARTGADLLDIDGKVQSISLANASFDSQGNPLTRSSEIKDPQQVDALLKMILAAPVDMKHCLQQGNVQDITFHLKDGTATQREYRTGSNEMQGCILLPKDFGVVLSSSQKK